MRVVDISAAAGIGLISVAALVVWSPIPYVQGSARYARQAALESYLASIAFKQGLPWFQDSAPSSICAAIEGYTNSTIVVGAVIAGAPCEPPPSSAQFNSSLIVSAGNRSVSLQAWQVEGA